MGELIGAGWDKPYSERTSILSNNGIAVWDVIRSCIRPGSDDAKIRDIEPNDFAAFFRAHPNVTKIGFNGQKAANAFEEFAGKNYPVKTALSRLPSTGSQFGRLSVEDKRKVYGDFMRV